MAGFSTSAPGYSTPGTMSGYMALAPYMTGSSASGAPGVASYPQVQHMPGYSPVAPQPYGTHMFPNQAGHFFNQQLPPVVNIASSITIRLTGDNYLFWRAQVGPLLRSQLLMGYVDGSLPCPDPHAIVPGAGGMQQVPNPAHQH